jgi:hypothetical protein
MDKRSSIRVEVNGQVSGKMVLVESLEILDISMTGIRFRCMRRVDMNAPHRLKIEKDNISVTLKGPIVRATFMGLKQDGDKCFPVYEVAMHFENMSDDDSKYLEKLIVLLSDE